VRAVAPSALSHRVVLDHRARLDGVRGRDVLAEVLSSVSEVDERAAAR
jgi:MoxR-like ATPase